MFTLQEFVFEKEITKEKRYLHIPTGTEFFGESNVEAFWSTLLRAINNGEEMQFKELNKK